MPHYLSYIINFLVNKTLDFTFSSLVVTNSLYSVYIFLVSVVYLLSNEMLILIVFVNFLFRLKSDLTWLDLILKPFI